MKTFVTTITAFSLFALSNLSLADQCPDTLNADEMYDCIVAEGAGGTYEGTGTESQTDTAQAVDAVEQQRQQQAKAKQSDSNI